MPIVEFNQNKKSKACVIYPDIPGKNAGLSADSRLEEAVGLALAINLDVIGQNIIKVREIKPATFLSRGILEKIKPVLTENEADLLIIDSAITPIQQRNLEKELQIKVIDRTALILEIFGERAQTSEGKLQVELAHLTYQRSRLVRSWTHLERQRGGAGFLGGPGETQIELDRRIIDDKIIRIKRELEKVKQTRDLQRSARQRVPYPVVALVGYTNAGKSSLFNRLSNSDVFAQDLLFATLDNTLRKIRLPSGREVILSDTVGFISDLPHELIMAFRATLEEVLAADIVVHVRDIANENTATQKKDVISVLKSLGLENIEDADNYIELLNKTDILDGNTRKNLVKRYQNSQNILAISALSGEGCSDFLDLIDKKLSKDFRHFEIKIPASDGALLAWIHRNADVTNTKTHEDLLILQFKINNASLSKLISRTEAPLKEI